MTFRILSVCTGNVCRSPIGELALAKALAPLGDVVVESAGIGALVGRGVPEPAQRLAVGVQIDAAAHVARQIEVPMIREANLVVAMAREHRRYIVESLPAAMRRTFTLRELARIAEALDDELPAAVANAGATTAEEGMAAAVALAASLRGTVPPPADPDEFDVIDPYRQSDEVYQRSFDELLPAADRVAAFLTRAATLATSA